MIPTMTMSHTVNHWITMNHFDTIDLDKGLQQFDIDETSISGLVYGVDTTSESMENSWNLRLVTDSCNL